MSKPALYVINKWPQFIEVFLQKDFEFWPGDKTSTLVTTFVLSLSIADSFIEKISYKQGIIRNNDPCYIKIIFVFLTEVIVIYMQFSIV